MEGTQTAIQALTAQYKANEQGKNNSQDPPSGKDLTMWDSIKRSWEVSSIHFNSICELPFQKIADLCDKHPCVGIPLLVLAAPVTIALFIATSPILIMIYLGERLKEEVCSPSQVSRSEYRAIRAEYGIHD